MDWPSIISEMGPWGVTLAVVVWMFLQRRNNDPERDEIFVRLRGVEERLTRVETDVSWIRSAFEKLEAHK